ncbi:hypothetical protein CXB51_019822 [Gossypium anomalum]|uniref:Uncharacterized protein n=1 Tax=Gossypium anomalum TaxID=47600 RepID=A0A8J5YTU0_9ROSI|nr:hypothetical protein CXB51_019822 [Gossypium anomalum]
MSTPSCFLLLLLCLSLQACSARRLVAVDSKHHKIDNILHFSIKVCPIYNDNHHLMFFYFVVHSAHALFNFVWVWGPFVLQNDVKNDRKNNSVAVLQAKSSSSKELRSMKEESIEESHGYNVTQKLEDAEVKYQKTIVENEKKKNPSVAVSWRVPHKKHGEKNPGFNLDYSPPKTHPPHHN